MAKFEETDGFIVKGWMRLRLGLSGGELFAYAIVYHFSQKSGAGVYIGGVPYLSAFIGCTQNTARTYLHNLTQRGLIIRIDATSQGVPFQHFKANPAFIPNIQDTPKKFEDTPKKFEGGGTPKKFEVESNNTKVPTMGEVVEYAKQQGFADPVGFADYYIRFQTENGWMTGKGKDRKPIDNWKLNVVAWGRYHKTEIFSNPGKPSTKTRDMRPEEYNAIFG